MGKPRVTKKNPYGLTVKQKLVKDLIVRSAESGQGLKATEAHQQVYSAKDKAGASQLAHQNLNQPNFRLALLDGLTKRRILGPNSKTEKRLSQGLNATLTTQKGKKITDYNARLKYIQEINKIAGVYAPEKKQVSKLNINLDLTTDQLKERNEQLQEELAT